MAVHACRSCDNCKRFAREQAARDRRRRDGIAHARHERELSDRYRGGSARERVQLRRDFPGVDFSRFN
jgi:hypothetical protein